jgi:hypothetical protein
LREGADVSAKLKRPRVVLARPEQANLDPLDIHVLRNELGQAREEVANALLSSRRTSNVRSRPILVGDFNFDRNFQYLFLNTFGSMVRSKAEGQL